MQGVSAFLSKLLKSSKTPLDSFMYPFGVKERYIIGDGKSLLFAGQKLVGPPSAADVFVLSAAAKLGATIVTYPLQLIKARQMSAGKHTHADRQYTGTLNAILRVWKTEGPPFATLGPAICHRQ